MKTMHLRWMILLSLALSGCASGTAVPVRKVSSNPPAMSRRFISLAQVEKGMTRKEIQTILFSEVVVGYELWEPQSELYKPITIQNPYRSEVVKKGSKTFEIDYYLVGIRQADGKVSDNELIPLVFHEDRLVGSGWTYLTKKIKN